MTPRMRTPGTIVVLVTMAGLTACGSGGTTSASAPAPTASPASTPTPTPSPSSSPSAAPLSTPDASAAPGSPAEVTAITKLVRTVNVTADYAHVVCQQYFTPALVTEVFGSLDTCEHSQDDSSPGSNPTAETVTNVQVQNDLASAHVTDHGGDAGGATGTWYLQRSGGDWRVAELGVDYLRSGFKLALGHQTTASAENPFADAAYRTCFVSTVEALPDDQFVATTYALDSGRSTVGKLVESCAAKAPGGVSPFRTVLDAAVKQGLIKDKASEKVISCTLEALKTGISDPDLTDDFFDEGVTGSSGGTALSALEAVSIRQCAGGTASPSPQASTSGG